MRSNSGDAKVYDYIILCNKFSLFLLMEVLDLLISVAILIHKPDYNGNKNPYSHKKKRRVSQRASYQLFYYCSSSND